MKPYSSTIGKAKVILDKMQELYQEMLEFNPVYSEDEIEELVEQYVDKGARLIFAPIDEVIKEKTFTSMIMMYDSGTGNYTPVQDSIDDTNKEIMARLVKRGRTNVDIDKLEKDKEYGVFYTEEGPDLPEYVSVDHQMVEGRVLVGTIDAGGVVSITIDQHSLDNLLADINLNKSDWHKVIDKLNGWQHNGSRRYLMLDPPKPFTKEESNNESA